MRALVSVWLLLLSSLLADAQVKVDAWEKEIAAFEAADKTNPPPENEIDYISIAPNRSRWAEVERVKAANRLIDDYIKENRSLRFINVFPHMLGPDGEPKPDIYLEDKLHMNAKGYELWRGIVRPY